MSEKPLTPADLAPPSINHLTVEQRIALWLDLMDACHQLQLAGIRREVGPDGDVLAVFRQRYAQDMEEHDRAMVLMAKRLNCPGANYGG